MPPATATKRSARQAHPRTPRPRQASRTEGATVRARSSTAHGAGLARLVPFGEIRQPGAYVSMWDGLLLRVTPRAIRSGGGPVLDVVGPEVLFVTKISDDPFVVVTKARLLASNLDVQAGF